MAPVTRAASKASEPTNSQLLQSLRDKLFDLQVAAECCEHEMHVLQEKSLPPKQKLYHIRKSQLHELLSASEFLHGYLSRLIEEQYDDDNAKPGSMRSTRSKRTFERYRYNMLDIGEETGDQIAHLYQIWQQGEGKIKAIRE